MANIINTLIKKALTHREFRFLLVGLLNTMVGYGSYSLFIVINIPYLIANTLATIIGITNSYLWNRFYTFKSKEKAFKEVLRFLSVYLISYLLSMLFLYAVVEQLKVNVYLAGILNIIITTLISWFGHKNYSFKKS